MDILLLQPYFLPFSLKVQTRRNSSSSSPCPSVGLSHSFLRCPLLLICPLRPICPPPLLILYIYLNMELQGCRETQNQHTVSVIKLSAEAEGHCSTDFFLNKEKKKRETFHDVQSSHIHAQSELECTCSYVHLGAYIQYTLLIKKETVSCLDFYF